MDDRVCPEVHVPRIRIPILVLVLDHVLILERKVTKCVTEEEEKENIHGPHHSTGGKLEYTAPMELRRRNALIGLNISSVVMSIAGLFAKLLPWPAAITVFGRMAVAAPFVLLFLLVTRSSLRLQNAAHLRTLIVLGIMLAVHWVTYFAAVQVSTVAVAIIAVYTTSIMATFLEPFFCEGRITRKNVLIALVAFGGVVVMMEEFSFGNSTTQGILLGLLSAFLVTLRNLKSKCFVKLYSPSLTMFYQLLFGSLFLSPLLFYYDFTVTTVDIQKLLILGVIATAFAHTLMLQSIGSLGARSVAVIMTAQPLFAIAAAVPLLGEIPGPRVIIGGLLVMSAMVAETLQQIGKDREEAKVKCCSCSS